MIDRPDNNNDRSIVILLKNFMNDSTAKKVSSDNSSTGEMGQKYLVAGENVALRLWQNEQPGESKPKQSRDYETVGYVISGKAELHLEDEVIKLESGDSWLVPQGAKHTYKIAESFTAVEATTPPARVDDRDE